MFPKRPLISRKCITSRAVERMQFFLADNAMERAWAWVVHAYGNIHMLKTVGHWMDGGGGYWVLFGLLLSCGLGVPLPEDIPLLLAGYFVADGKMNLALAGICALVRHHWRGLHSLFFEPTVRDEYYPGADHRNSYQSGSDQMGGTRILRSTVFGW